MLPSSPVKQRGLCCFLLLSAADLLLTVYLLRTGCARESNPLAAWCLARCGWWGLAAFKALTTLLAVAALILLARRRPRLARLALRVSCAAVGLVVFYSASLAAVVRPLSQHEEQRELAALAEENRILDVRCRQAHAYGRLLHRLGREVAGGKPLVEGVAELEKLGIHHDPSWLRQMRRIYPGATPRAILEAHLAFWACQSEPSSTVGDAYPPGAREARHLTSRQD